MKKKDSATCVVTIGELRLLTTLTDSVFLVLSQIDTDTDTETEKGKEVRQSLQRQRSSDISTSTSSSSSSSPKVINVSESFVFRLRGQTVWKLRIDLFCGNNNNNNNNNPMLGSAYLDLDSCQRNDVTSFTTMAVGEICFLEVQVVANNNNNDNDNDNNNNDNNNNNNNPDSTYSLLFLLESYGWVAWLLLLLFTLIVLPYLSLHYTIPIVNNNNNSNSNNNNNNNIFPVGRLELLDGLTIFEGDRIGSCFGLSTSHCSLVFLHMKGSCCSCYTVVVVIAML